MREQGSCKRKPRFSQPNENDRSMWGNAHFAAGSLGYENGPDPEPTWLKSPGKGARFSHFGAFEQMRADPVPGTRGISQPDACGWA